MNTNFNLLLLSSKIDVHPRSWICVAGKKLPETIRNLESSAIRKLGITRERLSIKLAESLDCSHNSFKKLFQNTGGFYPIPFILKLSEFAENRRILGEINSEIDVLKVNSASATPVKACRGINENLAKIIGAFMADGSLSIQVVFSEKERDGLSSITKILTEDRQKFYLNYSKARKQYYLSINKNKTNRKLIDSLLEKRPAHSQCHYAIELCDGYKDNVIFFKDLIEKEFSIKPNNFIKWQNMWRATFSNKVLARYLESFFSVWPGKKADYAFEPNPIKEAHFKTRKAFALGLLTFDGCVTKQGKMSFSSNSRILIDSLADIWEKDGIKFGVSADKRGGYTINAYLENKKGKLLQYFAPHTQKWKLIHWLSGNLAEKPIIKESKTTKISEKRILNFLEGKKSCDIICLTRFFKCSQSTARYYLKTLEKQGKIMLSNRAQSINPKNVGEKTTVLLKKEQHNKLFNKIRRDFVQDKEFAKVIEIKNATFSAWRKRKSRIPIQELERMCMILNLNLQEFCNNLLKEDREIAVIK